MLHTTSRLCRGAGHGAFRVGSGGATYLGDDALLKPESSRRAKITEGEHQRLQVAQHRNHHGIANCPKRALANPQEGPFTADEAAAQLGVTSSTIHRWLTNGVLPGKQLAPGAPWRIVLTDELRARLTRGAAPEGWMGLTDAARELGVSKSQVTYLVKTGKLPAVRVVVANRPCWRIDVSAAECRQQGRLLEQMISAVPEEA